MAHSSQCEQSRRDAGGEVAEYRLRSRVESPATLMRYHRVSSTLLLAATLITVTPSSAHADADGAVAWGILAAEINTAGVFALNFGVKGWPNSGPALILNMTPMVVGPGAAYAAHKAGLNPEPALAIHGASLVGFDLMLVGMLIDGRNERDGLRLGPTAWTLGALGAAAGGYAGATQFEGDAGRVFLIAPIGGFVVGGIVGMVGTLIATLDGTKAFKGAVIGAASGITLGVAASLIYALAYQDDDEQAAAAGAPATQRDKRDAPIMFSFGGAF